MSKRLSFLLLLACLWAPAASAGNVGFATASVPDPPGPPLPVGIWYPTQADAAPQPLGLFSQTVAPDAPLDGTGHRLVVISHGNGGSLDGHYDTALALAHAGFVVAAMTHTGDNYRDKSREADVALRPRAVHAVIGYMLADWSGHAALDPGGVGVFGFSSGGFTALVASGGVPDLSRIGPYCEIHRLTELCQIVRAHDISFTGPPPPPGTWIANSRIMAAVVAAPALGFTFAPDGLARVHIPVQLWRAEYNHVLPSPDYAEAVRDALPTPPEYHVVAGADHYDFLAPCSASLQQRVPSICRERDGFDRAAFHASFDAEVVRFFNQHLP